MTNSGLKHDSSMSPSVSITRASWSSVSHSRPTASNADIKVSKSAERTVSPAAIACPPNFTSKPGCRFDTRSSASRRWNPGIERPEPLICSSSPGAKVMVGRWNFSFSREATMPMTPWCQVSLNTLTV
ncbi:hypothetical protein D3C85_1393090 [compost metagenome]